MSRRRTRRRSRRRRSMPWKGWSRVAPRGHARTVMLRKCGKKCFLGPRKSFPICSKGTCKVNRKGVYAAYVRARQWGKPRSAYKSRGKRITYHGRKGTRRTYMKGSRPRHRRSVYTTVARKAKAILKRLGIKHGGNPEEKHKQKEISVTLRGGRRRRRKRSRSRKRRKRSRSRKRRKRSRSRKRRKRSRSRKRRKRSRSRRRRRSRSRRRRR